MLPPQDHDEAVMTSSMLGVGGDITEEPRNSDDPSSKFCWRECPDGVLDGDPLFDLLDTAVKCWSVLPSHVRSAVPTGRQLAVPLSVFENEEEPFLQMEYFDGMSDEEFSLIYVVHEVLGPAGDKGQPGSYLI